MQTEEQATAVTADFATETSTPNTPSKKEVKQRHNAKYRRTKNGFLVNLYGALKNRADLGGLTCREWVDLALASASFDGAYALWELNNFEKGFKPKVTNLQEFTFSN